jgi:membrane-associated protein
VLSQLSDLVEGTAWGYLAVFVLVGADSLFPAVPGEAALLTAGILAERGSLDAWLVILAGFLGAFLGDLAAFGIGRTFGVGLRDRVVHGRRGARVIAEVEGQLRTRGPMIIVTARFLPGGRQVTSYTAGALGMPLSRFAPFDALAALLWAVYGTLAGVIGGAAFKDSLWLPLLLATGIALAVGVLSELVRRARERSRQGS